MFGEKGSEIEKLVKGGKWDKIEKKYLHSNDENRLALANALCESPADECYNALVDLIKDDNKEVQLAAIKALGATGSERAVAQLQWVLAKTPESDTKTVTAVQAAIAHVRSRKR